jgi:hypothetical protein
MMFNASPVLDNAPSSPARPGPAGTIKTASSSGCGGASVMVFSLHAFLRDIQPRMGGMKNARPLGLNLYLFSM